MIANPYSMQGMDDPPTGYTQQLLIGLRLFCGIDALSGGAYKVPRRVHVGLCPAGKLSLAQFELVPVHPPGQKHH